MTRGFSRRGQPLIALVLVLGGWVSARAMMWNPAEFPAMRPPVLVPVAAMVSPSLPLPLQQVPDAGTPDAGSATVTAMQKGTSMGTPGAFFEPPVQADVLPAASSPVYRPDVESFAPARLAPAPAIRAPRPPRQAAPPPLSIGPSFAPVPAGITAGHQLLWMAALAYIPLPAGLLGLSSEASAPLPFYPAGSEPQSAANYQTANYQTGSRWSADAWVLWRRGSKAAPAGGLLIPSYGASQAGAVLRYRLAPGSTYRPAAYLRATAALNGSGEREAALGLSLRPIARLPLSLQGEARFTSTPGGHMVRPAAFVVTELPPFALPLSLRGEAYGQAGYVGGKFATGFADGQLRADHRLIRLGKADMRLGGGVWGGIQKGASRIDAGPSLTIGQPLGGPASMRLAADWRFRVVGKAAPGSGPAVTLSAGF